MLNEKLSKYSEMARSMGAADAVSVSISDVVFDPRTLLKCMYGCIGWGNCWVCPSAPGGLKPWEAEKILSRYKKGLLIHTRDKKSSQEISFEIERQAFIDGFYFAFSMSDCGLCQDCSYSDDKPCRFPKKARPAMQGMGIDVFETARRLGLPIETLASEKDEQNWYSLVLFE